MFRLVLKPIHRSFLVKGLCNLPAQRDQYLKYHSWSFITLKNYESFFIINFNQSTKNKRSLSSFSKQIDFIQTYRQVKMNNFNSTLRGQLSPGANDSDIEVHQHKPNENGASGINLDTGLELHNVLTVLKKIIPLEYASDWDNVGLLVEPSGVVFVKNILLTIDLTEKVLDEAISNEINLIIAYHPPLFKPFKSLTQHSWKERIAVRCIENRIAVFSPHTALDAIKGGINDYLLSEFKCLEVKPIERTFLSPKQMGQYEYSIFFPAGNEEFFKEVHQLDACLFKEEESNYILSCNCGNLPTILSLFQKHNLFFKIVNTSPKLPLLEEGMGRIATLSKPVTIKDVIETMKKHLNLDHLRLALSNIHTKDTLINSIAVCAGSGASVLRNVPSELYITGEMSHHEVLDIVHSGITVILCEHTNTERLYLKMLKPILDRYLKLNTIISELDSDPLKIV